MDNIPEQKRICKSCEKNNNGIISSIENEKHFLLDCHIYDNLRQKLGEHLLQQQCRWIEWNKEQQFQILFQPPSGKKENQRKIRKLIKEFICNIWEERKKFLCSDRSDRVPLDETGMV